VLANSAHSAMLATRLPHNARNLLRIRGRETRLRHAAEGPRPIAEPPALLDRVRKVDERCQVKRRARCHSDNARKKLRELLTETWSSLCSAMKVEGERDEPSTAPRSFGGGRRRAVALEAHLNPG
jgi:hypothetical protein